MQVMVLAACARETRMQQRASLWLARRATRLAFPVSAPRWTGAAADSYD